MRQGYMFSPVGTDLKEEQVPPGCAKNTRGYFRPTCGNFECLNVRYYMEEHEEARRSNNPSTGRWTDLASRAVDPGAGEGLDRA